MKKQIRNMALAVSVVMLSAYAVQAADKDLQNESQQAVTSFQKSDSTLRQFMADSAGYAVFPNISKGGLVVGGARGKGVVYDKGNNVIGEATVSQASFGAQAGGQTFREMIVFQTPAALEDFKTGKFEMSAEASAVAAAEGASKAAAYKHGIAVFTQSKKGLMVQASVGGQKFKFEPVLQPTGR